jgi:hypothetical protein
MPKEKPAISYYALVESEEHAEECPIKPEDAALAWRHPARIQKKRLAGDFGRVTAKKKKKDKKKKAGAPLSRNRIG